MATVRLPFDSVEARFTQRTGYIYDSMAKRMREKRSGTGRVLRVGRQIPFTKQEFREWLVSKLGGENGVIKCRYCAEYLSVDTFHVDHAIPIKQGGTLGLENLDLVCELDNQQKGGMCFTCYSRLLDWSAGGAIDSAFVPGLHPACRADMLHRLAIAIKLANRAKRDIAQKKSAEQKQQGGAAINADNDAGW